MRAEQAISLAKKALRLGDRTEARRLAVYALKLEPGSEEGWLILAAVADPRASQYYIERALRINPGSALARKGLEWNRKRLQNQGSRTTAQTIRVRSNRPSQRSTPSAPPKSRRNTILPWLLGILLLGTGMIAWMTLPAMASPNEAEQNQTSYNPAGLVKPSLTSSPTATYTSTPSPTPTPLATSTPTLTPTPEPSATPTPPLQNITGHWLDVNISEQRLKAYDGDKLVNSFAVSTGTWLTPTITGQFKIYVKYPYADMSGPGYYLPNVPYVMYFYKDYGIHGAYWHNNFGTPMSHGCVNMSPADAEWVYDFSRVGTLVNIHY